MNRIIMASFLAALTLNASAAHSGDRVVARVNAHPITHLETLSLRSERPELSYEKAVEFLVERALVLEWAKENRVNVSEEEVDNVMTSLRENNNLTLKQFEDALAARGQNLKTFRERLRDQLTASRAVSRAIGQRINVDDEEIEELYKKQFPARKTFSLSHLLFKVDDEASPETDVAARTKAEEALGKISGGKSFDEAAREWSEDTSTAPEGGILGTFQEGELMTELEEAIADLQPGEVAGPVRSSLGYHLVQLTGRGSVRPPLLDSVRQELIKMRSDEKREEAIRAWIKEIRGNYYIEIFEDR